MMFRLLPAAAMTATALAGMTAGAATVDVYGVVDTGLHYVKADSGDTSVTMDSGISKGSRVGLIGSEDLGGGYKIVFNLETGFSLDDGSFDNTKNRLFNRNAYLGVDSLEYLTLDEMTGATSHRTDWCHACFSGDYPVRPSDMIDSGFELKVVA